MQGNVVLSTLLCPLVKIWESGFKKKKKKKSDSMKKKN